MQKKYLAILIAAAFAGSTFAADNDHLQGGGQVTVVTEDSAITGVAKDTKLLGGWFFEENTISTEDYLHPEVNTDITLKSGTYDELIGGSYVRNFTASEEANKVQLGNTSVTMDGGEVQYVIGGQKASGGDPFYLYVEDVSVVINEGTITKDVTGGSYIKSTAGEGGVAAKTYVNTGDISLTINGGTFGTAEVETDKNAGKPATEYRYKTEGNVYGGSLAFNYYSEFQTADQKPLLDITDGKITVTITGGTFNQFLVGGSGAIGRNSTLTNEGSSLSITLADDATVEVGKHIVAGSMVQGGESATVNGDTSVAITGTGTLTAESVIGGNYITYDASNTDLYGGDNGKNDFKEQLTTSSTISGTASVLIDAAKATLTDEVIGGTYMRQVSGKDADNSSVSTVESTSVIVKNGTLKANLIGGGKTNANHGGYVESNVTGDTYVEISGGTIEGAVIAGGMAKTANTKATTDTKANVTGTATVVMTDGTVNGIIGGGMSYNYANAETDQNSNTANVGGTSITITGGTVEQIHYNSGLDETITTEAAIIGGGYAVESDTTDRGGSQTATVTGGTSIVLDGATVKDDIYGGGYAAGIGAEANVDTASIAISNATLGSEGAEVSVYAGGYAGDCIKDGKAVAASDASASVGEASLTLTNVTITGSVSTGGNSTATGSASTVTTASIALENTSVSNEISLAAETNESVTFTGANTAGSVTGTAKNFVFNVTDGTEDAVLTLTDENAVLDMTGAESIKATNVKSNSVLVRGLVSTAQDATIEVETPFASTVYAIGEQTEAQDLAFTSNGLKAGDQYFAGSTTVNANSKTLSESLLGSVAFVNQGAEFIADEGMSAINAAAREGTFTAFGALTGGRSKYETGSHVTVKGVTLAAGTAGKIGSLTLAGFVEAGWADSDSHVRGTTADGDHDYYGIGAAARYDFGGGFYADGALRLGMASTEFDGRYAGASAHYDADSFYTSAHIGGGYVYPLADAMSLNVYGRYLVTYLDGDDVGLGTASGEKLSLDSTVTHALRIGGRLTGSFCENATWKAGLAYEHVFDGDAESDLLVGGTRAALDTPSLEGNTGILELGVRVTPSADSPWSADIGLKGYAGDREGAMGSISVLYRF